MTETRRSVATTPARMPVLFAAHGAPILLDDPVWMGELATQVRTRKGQEVEACDAARRR